MSSSITTVLDYGWRWKQRDLDLSVLENIQSDVDWLATCAFPSEVHVELARVGKIPDPYVGFNEHSVQWIGDAEWLYITSVAGSDIVLDNREISLEFEGLDTYCDVYWNGKVILQTQNMFRSYTVLLSKDQILASDNILALHFASAKKNALELERVHGSVRAGSTNLGHPSRVYVRKAQYDWRWDWGPELMTAGPYRPISLRTYTARITDVDAHAAVSEILAPSLQVGISVAGTISAAHFARIHLMTFDGATVREETVRVDSKTKLDHLLRWDLQSQVDLWWPIGYGSQARYTVEVSLLTSDGSILDSQRKTIGFRRVLLVQEPLNDADQYGKGKTFLFEVNNIRIFIGGANWVPADNFLTTVSATRLRAWLNLLRDGNMNMVRLWGGGVYEPDLFYDICDELGILVWQDFQFACGVYPGDDAFVSEVASEADDVVRRLRHHPSLALFCGNNEDYQMIHQWPDVPRLPARKIYEQVLPDAVAKWTHGTVPYHPGSPYAEGCLTIAPDGREICDTADPTMGDVHQWEIWGGRERPYQEYDRRGGRFVSEFGIPALPSLATVEGFYFDTTPPSQGDRHPQSKALAQHCRAGAFERRFAIVLYENIRPTADLETYVYNTQLIQSEAISYAYRSWRREWRGRGKEFTSGVIVWQLNDCWPVTSWAIVDYFLRPKPAYYTIARELRGITVGISRTVEQNRMHDRPRQFYEFGAYQSLSAKLDVWATNSTLQPQEAILELSFVDLVSSWTHQEVHRVKLQPNMSTELLSAITCEAPPGTNSSTVVIGARLLSTNNPHTVLARASDWPQPLKYALYNADPKIEVTVSGEDIRVRAARPVKCLVLSVEDDGLRKEGFTWERWQESTNVHWSDNALDLMPGDEQSVWASGLAGRHIKVAYLGHEQAFEI